MILRSFTNMGIFRHDWDPVLLEDLPVSDTGQLQDLRRLKGASTHNYLFRGSNLSLLTILGHSLDSKHDWQLINCSTHIKYDSTSECLRHHDQIGTLHHLARQIRRRRRTASLSREVDCRRALEGADGLAFA